MSEGEQRKSPGDEPPEPTAWSALDWASMSPDQIAVTIAAMNREHEARRPEHEARLARERRAAETWLIEAVENHMRALQENPFSHMTMEERNALQAEIDATL